ncbi:uncharacterized protein LOC112555055 isoform X3 [Pomacea canaliculata]|uniref:uncharacterized protein LOC112555055 isoform X3 n=1 Tax=Pomacea canaliculata TaxID=400727 RepID=UPI000D73D1C3|nr:uncharacterized protein LOC112555055 isoform X3 [Pomacea canaliculata]
MRMSSWFCYAAFLSATCADEATLQLSDTTTFVFSPEVGASELGDDLVDVSAIVPSDPGDAQDSRHGNQSLRSARSALNDNKHRHSGVACLERQEKFKMLSKNRPLQMVLIVEEGEEARMSCHFCEDSDNVTETRRWDALEMARGRPLSQSRVGLASPILWYSIAHYGHGTGYRLTEVEPSMHDDDRMNRIYISTGHTLIIERTKASDAGTYFCRDTTVHDRHIKPIVMHDDIQQLLTAEGTFRFLIHLDVLKTAHIPVKEVSPTKANNKPLPSSPVNHGSKNLQVFWEWGEWGPCSTCDTPGETHKRGVCSVRKLHNDRPVTPWYLDAVLNTYPSGVPCRSSLFHQEDSGMLDRNLLHSDELEKRDCSQPCKAGFLKGFMTRKSISPTGLKKLSFVETKKADAQVTIVNETVGDTVELYCPGAKVDEAVVWVNKSKYIPSNQIRNATGGRAWVSANGTLHISTIILADRGPWMCVVGGEKKGHVYLNVLVPESRDFQVYGWWVIMSFPIYFIVFILLLAVKHWNRKGLLVVGANSDQSADYYGDASEDDNVNRACVDSQSRDSCSYFIDSSAMTTITDSSYWT